MSDLIDEVALRLSIEWKETVTREKAQEVLDRRSISAADWLAENDQCAITAAAYAEETRDEKPAEGLEDWQKHYQSAPPLIG